MSKLIFFDIDGTLWDERMQIPDSTGETVRKLRQRGHKTLLCSGRARSNICSERLLELGFDGIVAACGCHVELGGEMVYERLLTPEQVRRVIRLLRECHMPVVLEGPAHHWIDEKGFEEDPFVLYLFQEMGERALPLRGYSEDIRINKFSGDILPDTNYGRLKRELEGEFDLLEHDKRVVEFVPKGNSKATGIRQLCSYLKVPVSDTYGVGDSVNDLDMLRFVGHSIAMGNGSEEAKEAAEFVTASIHRDGIKKAMEHYGLIS